MRIAFLGTIYCPLYGVVRGPFWRGYQCMDFYGETIAPQKCVRYIAMSVSVKQGFTVHVCISLQLIKMQGTDTSLFTSG